MTELLHWVGHGLLTVILAHWAYRKGKNSTARRFQEVSDSIRTHCQHMDEVLKGRAA